MAARPSVTPQQTRSRPVITGRRRVLGVSGPDGSGKSTLVRTLRDGLAGTGLAVRLGYGYGCVLCRRLNRPSGVAGNAFAQRRASDDPAPDVRSPASGAPAWQSRLARLMRTSRLARLMRIAHGHVDAAELRIRLTGLGWAAAWRPSAVIVTDRGPLDGLAKHDPPPGSVLARHYLGLAGQYDLIVLLDAPAEVLAHRDGEHLPEELEHWRSLYRFWAGVAAAAGTEVLVADAAARAPDAIAAELVRTMTSHIDEPP